MRRASSPTPPARGPDLVPVPGKTARAEEGSRQQETTREAPRRRGHHPTGQYQEVPGTPLRAEGGLSA